MIIQYLIDTILSERIKTLPFVERYGGVTQVLSSKVLADNNKTKLKKYPVSCCVSSKDCNDNGLYQDLVPDETKKSIVYWEVTNPMSNIGETPNLSNFNKKRFKGSARIIVWLNLANLGVTEIEENVTKCNAATFTIPSVLNALAIQGKIDTGIYAGNRIYIEPRKIVNDKSSIFGKYDYPEALNYYLYPYGYYAIDVDFQMDMCYNNSFVFPVFDTIQCIDYSCEPSTVIPQNGLFVHLDAAKGVNGGNPSEGEGVFLWADQSGNNNDFGQADGSLQPSFTNSGINSLPSINFDTASYLAKTGLSIGSNEVSVFIVMKREGGSFGGYGAFFMLSSLNYTNAGSDFLLLNTQFSNNLNAATNSLDKTLSANDTSPYIYSLIKSSTDMEYFTNGVSIGINLGVQTLGGVNHYIGGWFNNLFNGFVPEVIIYNRKLDATETADVNTYLKDKYNL